MDLSPTDEILEHMVEFYDRVAPTYDAWAAGFNGKVAGKLVELAIPVPGEACLDVGCGTGLVARRLAERVLPGGSVVGIDLSDRMLDEARRTPMKGLTYTTMAAENLVFRDHSFDLITFGQSLPYMVDPLKSLEEAVRMLRPGGRVALSLHRRSLHTQAHTIFFSRLGALGGKHEVRLPGPAGESSVLGERETLPVVLQEFGFADIQMTELVTGGRTANAREWNELMAGSGPLPNTLLSMLGPRLKASFEEDLTQAMEPLGDEAFRYHFAILLAVGTLIEV